MVALAVSEQVMTARSTNRSAFTTSSPLNPNALTCESWLKNSLCHIGTPFAASAQTTATDFDFAAKGGAIMPTEFYGRPDSRTCNHQFREEGIPGRVTASSF
jgi:hypothetical protein